MHVSTLAPYRLDPFQKWKSNVNENIKITSMLWGAGQ
jgi:hypothetical protein